MSCALIGMFALAFLSALAFAFTFVKSFTYQSGGLDLLSIKKMIESFLSVWPLWAFGFWVILAIVFLACKADILEIEVPRFFKMKFKGKDK